MVDGHVKKVLDGEGSEAHIPQLKSNIAVLRSTKQFVAT